MFELYYSREQSLTPIMRGSFDELMRWLVAKLGEYTQVTHWFPADPSSVISVKCGDWMWVIVRV